jgi:hypothetical protein
MTIVTGAGKIISGLTKHDTIAYLRQAQRIGDNYCSVHGAELEGHSLVRMEREAGYTCGADARMCEICADWLMS